MKTQSSRLNAVTIKNSILPYNFYMMEQQIARFGTRSKGWVEAGLCPFHNDGSAGSFFVNLENGAQNVVSPVEQIDSRPEFLYKIVSPQEWRESELHTRVVTTPIDQGFIHLAREDQVAHIVQKYWKNQDYVLLKLASNKLQGSLVYETNPGGTNQYYHLYDGNIPLDAVVEATPVYITQKKRIIS